MGWVCFFFVNMRLVFEIRGGSVSLCINKRGRYVTVGGMKSVTVSVNKKGSTVCKCVNRRG